MVTESREGWTRLDTASGAAAVPMPRCERCGEHHDPDVTCATKSIFDRTGTSEQVLERLRQEAVERGCEVEKLRRELRDLRKDNENLRQKAEGTRLIITPQAAAAEQALQLVTHERDELAKELEKLRKDAEQPPATNLPDAREQVRALQAELRDLRKDAEQPQLNMPEQVRLLTERCGQLAAELEAVKRHKELLTRERDDTRKVCDALREQLRNSGSIAQGLAAQRDALRKELEATRAGVAEMRNELIRVKEQRDALRREGSGGEALKMELEHTQAGLDELRKELARVKEQRDALRRERSSKAELQMERAAEQENVRALIETIKILSSRLVED